MLGFWNTTTIQENTVGKLEGNVQSLKSLCNSTSGDFYFICVFLKVGIKRILLLLES